MDDDPATRPGYGRFQEIKKALEFAAATRNKNRCIMRPGHGRIDDMQQLQCCALRDGKQRFPFNIKEKPILPLLTWEKEPVADADVLVVLDYCNSGKASRGGLESSPQRRPRRPPRVINPSSPPRPSRRYNSALPRE
jgi:hypothetical protein